MVDANCAFDEMEALRRGHAFEELDVYWFEEPLKPSLLAVARKASAKAAHPDRHRRKLLHALSVL
jgi:L-alanine-DL-glutamate epimerase-like enolase superfamily enzyme